MSRLCWSDWANDRNRANEKGTVSIMAWELIWEPHLPVWLLSLAVVLSVGLLSLAWVQKAPAILWRTAAFALLTVALFNPTVREEQRQPLNDIALVVTDRSLSQEIAGRRAKTDTALSGLNARLDRLDNLDVRHVEASAGQNDGTALFAALDTALADVPRERLGAVFFLTDGEIHDVPSSAEEAGLDAPIHGLITGEPGERDRKLTVERAPRFGIVGETLVISFKVEDAASPSNDTDTQAAAVPVTVHIDGKESQRVGAALGATTDITVTLTHGGANVIELEAAAGPDELTLQNNRAAIIANGIRDRLRVLLVSGEPHPGERTWRNLLKADPSVDLVHFTILRPPEKQDGTPISELSLIAFPTRELFSQKLDDFDLIIFDRYRRRGVLPLVYLDNVTRYVEKGGAVLMAAGPAFATPYSIYRTPLAGVLPAQPTGAVVEQGYRAKVTEQGERHPVTAGLARTHSNGADWGRWFRLVEVEDPSGDIVLTGPGERPLMILDRIGQGRVAQLLSDHAWLWARGFEGGGPQAELLRRTAHWLMKEPDLEEENLTATIAAGALSVTRTTMDNEVPDATVTLPSGRIADIGFDQTAPGAWVASLPATEVGLYRIAQGELTTVTAIGQLNPREFSDVRATKEKLQPMSQATSGGLFWVGDGDIPSVRQVRQGRNAAGANWAGLVRNEQYLVQSVRQTSLVAGPLALVVLLAGLFVTWRKEGS